MYLLYKEKINAKRVAFGHQTFKRNEANGRDPEDFIHLKKSRQEFLAYSPWSKECDRLKMQGLSTLNDYKKT
jgi:hypothetical protein